MTTIVVQTAFLGDVLLTTPLLVALRRLHPERRLILVTTPQAAAFFTGLPFADEVVAFDKRGAHRRSAAASRLARSLSTDPDTIAIVPHKSLRTTRFVRALRPTYSVAFRDAAFSWLYDTRIPYPDTGHYADKVLALLRGVTDTDSWTKEAVGSVQLYTAEDLAQARALVRGDLDGAVVLAPGSVWPTKRWPLERFRAVAERLAAAGERVIVIGVASMKGAVPNSGDRIVDLCGSTTLRQAAAVVGAARVVAANDSAPLHLASLQGIPVVGIFGPTIPEFGFAPFGPKAAVVQVLQPCAPCSIHGTAECPIGTHRCMTDVTPDMVLAALTKEHV